MKKYRYIEPDILSRIYKRKVTIGRVKSGKAGGLHLSSIKGSGSEYLEHRLYQPGDDMSRIDWRLSARREHFFVRENEEDANFTAYFVLDGSGSMDFASASEIHTKFSYCKRLISHLIFFFMSRKDSVMPIILSKRYPHTTWKRGKEQDAASCISLLRSWKSGGELSLPCQLRKAAFSLRKQGVVLVFSDFIDPFFQDSNISALLRDRGRRLVCIKVNDPVELIFPFRRFHKFIDPEDGAFSIFDSAKVRKRYAARMAAHLESVQHYCRKEGALLIPLSTDLPLELALDTIIEKCGRKA